MRKLLLDFSPICYRSRYVMEKQEFNTDYNFWFYNILLQLQKFINLFKPNELILAVDSRSWRKDFFKHYKANRVHTSEDDVKMFEEMNNFILNLKELFPYKLIQVAGAEADDIIAVLILNKKEEDFIYILSPDYDFVQLIKDGVMLYEPTKMERVGEFFPCSIKSNVFDTVNDYVLYHCLNGDSGDGVPNVLSEDDVFVTVKENGKKGRQKSFGINKFLSIKRYGVQKWIEEQPDEVKKNIERNKKLIGLNLKMIPEEVQKSIIEEYNNYQIKQPNKELILDFFKSKNINSLIEKVEEFYII